MTDLADSSLRFFLSKMDSRGCFCEACRCYHTGRYSYGIELAWTLFKSTKNKKYIDSASLIAERISASCKERDEDGAFVAFPGNYDRINQIL